MPFHEAISKAVDASADDIMLKSQLRQMDILNAYLVGWYHKWSFQHKFFHSFA